MKDVLVVGAGPAGSFIATLLARRGLDVLLVDRARFPRWTVCGACLSGAAVGQLRAEGLAGILDEAGAVLLARMELRGWGRRADLRVFGGRVLSRAALDQALATAARDSGAELRMGTRARLGPWSGAGRQVELVGEDGSPQPVHARVVVAATGLHPLPGIGETRGDTAVHLDPGSRVGVGAVVLDWEGGPARGTVRMTVGPGGYAGQVRQEDGSWVLAGALDPAWLRARGGPGPAMEALIAAEGASTRWVVREGWRGTPALTRRRAPRAEEGVFYLGDAAGYVEPFTGEGMGWALRGARELQDLVVQGVSRWSPHLVDEWDRLYERRVGSLQGLCRGLAWLGRRPTLARSVVSVVSWAPWLARPALRRVSGVPLGLRAGHRLSNPPPSIEPHSVDSPASQSGP